MFVRHDGMHTTGILIEAEDFDDHGGWVLDSQFEVQMGSPYLLAHGLGRPVADASTVVRIEAGTYEVWVRAKDWAPSGHPGRFTLAIDGTTLDADLGANGEDWSWQSAGTVDLPGGDTSLVLHDLTGFDGRCDAIFLSADGSVPPSVVDEASRAWRNTLRGLPSDKQDSENGRGTLGPSRERGPRTAKAQVNDLGFRTLVGGGGRI